MSRRILVLVIGMALGLVVLTPSSSDARAMPDQRFGMTEVFWLPDEARELGIGWERILFYWREIQPEGPEDWNTLHVHEEWLVEAASQGREVVGLIKNTAPWASIDGTEAGLPKGLELPLDHPDNLWANYVRRLADYYGPLGVHHWIIWNEPEIEKGVYGFEFAGSAADYYQLLGTAYKVIKERDPEAVIHLAGLTWWHDPTFLDRLLSIAANDPESTEYGYFFDVISLHIYFRTETIRSIIDDVNQIQKRYGLAKPIWINETNAPPNRDPEWPVERPRFNIDLEQQAWFIVQAMALGFASGAERISVYKLLDIHLPPGGESFGVLRPDQSRRPAFDAFKMSTRCFGHFNEVDVEFDSLAYRVTFERPDSLTHVAWSRTPAGATVRIPSSTDGAFVVDLADQVTRVQPDTGQYTLLLDGQRCDQECLVGGEPVVLVEVLSDGAYADSCLSFRSVPEDRTVNDGATNKNDQAATPRALAAAAGGGLDEPVIDDQGAGDSPASVANSAEPNDADSAGSSGDSDSSFVTQVAPNVAPIGVTPAASSDSRDETAHDQTALLGPADPDSDGGNAGLWVIGLGLGLGLVIVFLSFRTRAEKDR